MAPRIVSLVPSVTETLLAWGVEPIAVTRFCEQPQLRQVGGTKDPDLEAIVALGPDAVVMDEEENRREDAEALHAAGVPLVVTAVRSLRDVERTLRELARACGLDPAAPAIDAVAAGDTGGEAGPRLRAFVPIWRRPWMTISNDTYAASLLGACGVAVVFGECDVRYPNVTLADAAAARPDVVLAPDEPYPFRERHREELQTVAPVRFVDGKDVFWWGVRTAGALVRLRRIVDELATTD